MPEIPKPLIGPIPVPPLRRYTNVVPTTDADSTKRLLPWLVALAFFMEALDTTILNTAVPVIAAALNVAPLSMKSVLSSYTLSLAVFIPVSSWIADRFGTRRVFSSAIGVFTLGSVLCGLCSDIHLLVAARILQGCGGAMMVPVGRLTLVRTFARSELIQAVSFVAIPALIGPMLGPMAGGLIVGWFHWRMIFFVNLPIGLAGLYFVYRNLPDYREPTGKLDVVGLILFSTGVALFSYVLEVFGEHTLSGWEILGLLAISLTLIWGYVVHARRTPAPLLRLDLLRLRTLRTSVNANIITPLGIGGMPFLLPLLYQIGLGYSPIQSGLLIVPQSLAAITLKMTMPKILHRFGFRNVLVVNTVLLGLSILSFILVQQGTPAWLIVIFGALFGFLTSLQFTSMNTLAYADIETKDTSMASTIMSTVQQMSMSFGIATASLATALFIPAHLHEDSGEMVRGLHHAFLLLGITTAASSLVFRKLKPNDGENVSQHKMTEHLE
jgi:EmrB/QacA subfamily drug resistance transporter